MCNPMPSPIFILGGDQKNHRVPCFDRGGLIEGTTLNSSHEVNVDVAARKLAIKMVKKSRNPRPVRSGTTTIRGIPFEDLRQNFTTTHCSQGSTTELNLYHKEKLPPRTFFGCYPLAPAAFQRSLVAKTNNARLQRVIRDASQGRRIVIAVIGGSVACATTEKGHCLPETSSSFHFF